MGSAECVILAGLTDNQKSYLRIPPATRVIEITILSEVEKQLSSLELPKREELRCRSSEVLEALVLAHRTGKRLVVDEAAKAISESSTKGNGIVVVEAVADASTVLAINYASSVGAGVLLVAPLADHDGQGILKSIELWKRGDDRTQLEKLKDEVMRRIGRACFAEFDHATFFTEGLPYSLVLENCIPCCYVHLSLNPDLFIIDSIIFEKLQDIHSAIVFSPLFFPDEETSTLCGFLSRNRYYVRSLLGRSASLASFDFHAQHFPYALLHICSHGGEVDGYEMVEEFVDRDGNKHTVQFDEVIGVTPVPDNDKIVEVHRKMFPRTLDGFAWRSEELSQGQYPEYVIAQMWDCMRRSTGTRKSKGKVPMSCSIACVDSIHQGQFHVLASHRSPIVFNNACWSGHEVAKFFLACAARAYIGTLWAVENEAAVTAARVFYENVLTEPVLYAMHKANKALDKTNSKDIYIYWGLPWLCPESC